MSGHTEEVERVVDSPNESDCDLICDESNNKNKFAGEKMDERDELYDPSKFILSYSILKKTF